MIYRRQFIGVTLIFTFFTTYTICRQSCTSTGSYCSGIILRSSTSVLAFLPTSITTTMYRGYAPHSITATIKSTRTKFPRWNGENNRQNRCSIKLIFNSVRSYHTTSSSLRSSTFLIGGNDDVDRTSTSSNSTKHYVFGYGSLMCPLSRQVTNANLMNKFTIPIVIHQLERAWCARTTTGYTAMGVQFVPPNHNSTRFCTGILIGTINSMELEDLDRREASYNRLSVPLETISTVPFMDVNVYDTEQNNSSSSNNEHDSIKDIMKINSDGWKKAPTALKKFANHQCDPNVDHPNIHVWVYVPKNPTPPDASHPILQSYVDIIMRGCFNIVGEPFARSFISTTTGWSSPPTNSNVSTATTTPRHHHYWVNDRDLPIYKRSDRIYSILNAAKIDHVIFDELSSMRNCNSTNIDDNNSSCNATIAVYRRNTYDPLLHLEQLTHCLEQDYDSVHPMAFQHFASQIQVDHTSQATAG